jgi:hypothetical protein
MRDYNKKSLKIMGTPSSLPSPSHICLLVSESSDQIKCKLRLIIRHHVSSLSHQHINDVLRLMHIPCHILVHLPDIPRCIQVVVLALKVQLLQKRNRRRISHNDVELAVVEADAVLVEQLRQPWCHRVHHVLLQMQLDLVLLAVEAVERVVTHVDGLADIGAFQELGHAGIGAIIDHPHVVEVRVVAGHVLEERPRRQLVHVDELVEDIEGGVKVTLGDGVAASFFVLVERFAALGVDEAELEQVVAVDELVLRVTQTVADGHALEVDFELGAAVAFVDCVAQGWHVLAGITLARDVELVLL